MRGIWEFGALEHDLPPVALFFPLHPRILQLHPRAEAIWVRASNWEMARGNFQGARSTTVAFVLTLAFLQRAIRINKHSSLLWREYFRFELAYINLIEERRRVLGLPVIAMSCSFPLVAARASSRPEAGPVADGHGGGGRRERVQGGGEDDGC